MSHKGIKIAHIADTHIKNLKYHDDYRACFEQMYETLRQEEVDYIVHCGDIAHTKTQISPEFVEMASDFFTSLSEIATTFIILGNHDGNLKNSNRQDAITPIVQAIDSPHIRLLKNSGETSLAYGNIVLNVLSVFDRDNWVRPTNPDKVNIALYHGAITNCQTDAGWIMEHGEDEVSIFDSFDYAMLGDIHKRQFLDEAERIYYPGSTIQQNHGETNDKGFSIWTIDGKDSWEIDHYTLENPRPFITIELTSNGKIPKNAAVPKGSRLRIVSNNNLPIDVMKRAVDVAKHKFSPESVSYLNRAAGQRGDVSDLSNEIEDQNLRDPQIQEELISEYLKDYQVKDFTMRKIYGLNSKYNEMVEAQEDISRNVNWKLVSFEWSNLFNYGARNSIDFNNVGGIVGIFGKNFSGKSSIIDAFLFTMFNTTSKNERKNVNVVNQNRDNAEGKLVIQVGSKVYTIHRSVAKYTKKGKEGETVEAKTDLDFSVYDPITDKTTSLNGTTRNQTDTIIRRHFGSIEDFLVSSMASQTGALAFINEGSTKRKEIIAKFLDLQFFDRKFRLAKEDSISSKALMKKLDGRDYEKEISKASDALVGLKDSIAEFESKVESAKLLSDSYSGLLAEVEKKISETPTEVVDITNIRKKLKSSKNQILSLSNSITEETLTLEKEKERSEKIGELMNSLDYSTLSASLGEIEKSEAELKSLTRKLKQSKEKGKLLDDIPCGDSFPACKFIRDAHVASATIPEVSARSQEVESVLKGLLPDVVRDHLDKFRALENKGEQTKATIANLKLSIERNSMSLERIRGVVESLHASEVEYENNKEAIKNLEKLISEKDSIASKLSSAKASVAALDKEKLELYKLVGSKEQKISTIKSQQKEFEEIRAEYAAYDLFLRCMHSNGIAYDIIKKKLPVINEEIAKILSNVVEFEVFFETSGNKFDIFIKHAKHGARPIEMASGAEKTMAAMAIRLALLAVSTLPTSDAFILDEPGTALDEENMAGFIQILDLIKVFFKNVLLISHLDSLKDSVDMQIVIDKQNGFARVNQ